MNGTARDRGQPAGSRAANICRTVAAVCSVAQVCSHSLATALTRQLPRKMNAVRSAFRLASDATLPIGLTLGELQNAEAPVHVAYRVVVLSHSFGFLTSCRGE